MPCLQPVSNVSGHCLQICWACRCNCLGAYPHIRIWLLLSCSHKYSSRLSRSARQTSSFSGPAQVTSPSSLGVWSEFTFLVLCLTSPKDRPARQHDLLWTGSVQKNLHRGSASRGLQVSRLVIGIGVCWLLSRKTVGIHHTTPLNPALLLLCNPGR